MQTKHDTARNGTCNVTTHTLCIRIFVCADAETRQGAFARAVACHAEHERQQSAAPDYAVGLEGGCIEENVSSAHPSIPGLSGSVVSCFAFLAVLQAGPTMQSPRWGVARTASFDLPPGILTLMRGPAAMELGTATDQVFSEVNSKQKGGAIGKVTNGLIDRTAYYVHALICALAPFVHEGTGLYDDRGA